MPLMHHLSSCMPRQQAEILPCSLKSIKSACALCSIYSSGFDTLVMPGPCCICCTVRQAKNDDDGGSSFFNRCEPRYVQSAGQLCSCHHEWLMNICVDSYYDHVVHCQSILHTVIHSRYPWPARYDCWQGQAAGVTIEQVMQLLQCPEPPVMIGACVWRASKAAERLSHPLY